MNNVLDFLDKLQGDAEQIAFLRKWCTERMAEIAELRKPDGREEKAFFAITPVGETENTMHVLLMADTDHLARVLYACWNERRKEEITDAYLAKRKLVMRQFSTPIPRKVE